MKKRLSRTQARTEAFKLIFAKDLHKDDIDELFTLLLEEKPEAQVNMDYIRQVVLGVIEKEEELSEMIQEHLSAGWKIDRVSKVSLSALYLALYEMKYMEDVPKKVAINEAIELVKQYDDPERAAFVNGVLGSVSKEIEKD